MKLAVGIKMLDHIAAKEPNITTCPAYMEAKKTLLKDPNEIDTKEKLELLDRLEALCIVVGISYARVLEQAWKECGGE